MAKASVIIPTFNEEKYIGSCLEKLAGQTFKRFELIISDCNSTDRTRDIAKKHKAKIVLSPKKNRASACNEALKHAEGKYVLFTDADVDVPPDWVEKYVEYLDKNKEADLVGAPNITHPSDGFIARAIGALRNISAPVYLGKKLIHVPACNCAYRSSVFKRIHFDPDILTAEDMDVNLQLVAQGGTIVYASSPQVFHHRRDSITKFGRQMFKYGVGYAQLWLKYKKLLGIRQMFLTLMFPVILSIPLLFVLMHGEYLWLVVGAGYLAYLLRNMPPASPSYLPMLPPLAFLQHFSFSTGAWYELLNQRFLGRVYATHKGEK